MKLWEDYRHEGLRRERLVEIVVQLGEDRSLSLAEQGELVETIVALQEHRTLLRRELREARDRAKGQGQ